MRASRGKSVQFSRWIKHLRGPPVLRGLEQDSTEVAEKIGPLDAEGVLSEIPRQARQRGWEH